MALVALGLALAPRAWRLLYARHLLGPLHRDAVILVVLDDVRADHLSLCGYARPTSPRLDALALEGRSTCGGVAPGTWTLPSHASFFTGAAMLEHGAHELPSADAPLAPGTSIPIRGLDNQLPTLAEQMVHAGRQTGLVSANPVLGPGSGLNRGFEHTLIALHFGDLDGDEVVAGVERMMDERLDPLGGPLFLVVNIADAHQPWAAVPEGLSWLPPRPALSYLGPEFEAVWKAYYNGGMSPEQQAAFLAQLRDVYDYGVWRADAALGGVLDTLRARGWCGGDCRVIVVSDHGEMLGEHDMIDHGFCPWEENARVPIVAAGWPLDALPSPLSATAVYGLALDGALPQPLPPATQVAFGHPQRAAATGGRLYAQRMVSMWEGPQKWVWWGGRSARFDLGVDPQESQPQAPEPSPALFGSLKEQAKGFAAGGAIDETLRLQLEAAGYLEPASP